MPKICPPTCCVDGCETKYLASGCCNRHYKQIQTYGRLLTEEEIHERRSSAASKRTRVPRKGWKVKDTSNMMGKHPKSEFKKGFTPWNAGLKGWADKDHIESIRKANTGRPPWNKGKKLPSISGELNPAWKGGTKSENDKQRAKFRRYTQKTVFERDDYTCQICNTRGGSLQVDHIKGWSKYPELRFEISNCRTLCMACHYYITFKRKMPEGIIWGHGLSRRIKSFQH